MTGIISGIVIPKDKTESNPYANQKVRSITKSAISFLSFPVSLRGAFGPKELPALKHGTKMNRGNKSASWTYEYWATFLSLKKSFAQSVKMLK